MLNKFHNKKCFWFDPGLSAMATHSSTLAWKIAWTACSPWGREESTEWLHFHLSLSRIGEGNGNPLQCSCRENPRDGGAWWAAVYGVAQSWTRLNRLSSSSSRIIWMPYIWFFNKHLQDFFVWLLLIHYSPFLKIEVYPRRCVSFWWWAKWWVIHMYIHSVSYFFIMVY